MSGNRGDGGDGGGNRAGDGPLSSSSLGRSLPLLVFAAALVGIWLGIAFFAAIS